MTQIYRSPFIWPLTDTVSRVWRKTKGYWVAWNASSLEDEPIIRLIINGTVVGEPLDKKSTGYRCWWRSACGPIAES